MMMINNDGDDCGDGGKVTQRPHPQLLVVLAAVVSVIMYRMAVAVAMYQTESPLFRRNAKLVTSITAASLNLAIIIVFNFVRLNPV